MMINIGSLLFQSYNHTTLDKDRTHNIKWIGIVHSINKKSNGNEAIISISKIENQSFTNNFKILAQLDSVFSLKVGDVITSKSRLYPFKKVGLSTQFDYRSFMHFRKIHFKVYLNDWIKIKHENNLFYYAQLLREKARRIFKEKMIDKSNFGVLNALILGDKSFLESDTRNNFAKAGVMHILAVSGLHVGIIYLILNFLFAPFKKYKIGRLVKMILSISFIWLFAFVTGLSPSVQRAAFMFTVLIVGDSLVRPSHVLNSIFGSAIVLLIFNPNLIFEVGFQLSYSAVLGIVITFPFLRKKFYVKNKLLRYIVELSLVSIVAQLSTMTLAMYYFHQFPNYFLLFNLFVIPLTFLIVILAISTLLLSFLSPISDWLAYLLDTLLSIMQWVVNQSSILKYSHTTNIFLDHIELILVGCACGAAILFLGGLFKRGILLSALCCFGLLIYNNFKLGLTSKDLRVNTLCFGIEEVNYISISREAAFFKDSSMTDYEAQNIYSYLKSKKFDVMVLEK